MTAIAQRDRLRAKLADLKMPGSLEALDAILSRADGGSLGIGEALEGLLDAQIDLRRRRRLDAATRTARLPCFKTLDDYDFTLQPSVDRGQLASLHELHFLARHENVVFCGPPGVGKTHLAVALAIAAIEVGRSVHFATLLELVDQLRVAQRGGTLRKRMSLLLRPALLVVDEIGYLPVSEDGARLFFQLMNARHETRSTILTTNKGFEEWGAVLGDEVMAGALLDRVLHRCHVVNIKGASYRMRQYRAMHGIADPAAESGDERTGQASVAPLPPPSPSEMPGADDETS